MKVSGRRGGRHVLEDGVSEGGSNLHVWEGGKGGRWRATGALGHLLWDDHGGDMGRAQMLVLTNPIKNVQSIQGVALVEAAGSCCVRM